jgi:hypothetical protein
LLLRWPREVVWWLVHLPTRLLTWAKALVPDEPWRHKGADKSCVRDSDGRGNPALNPLAPQITQLWHHLHRTAAVRFRPVWADNPLDGL